MDYSDNSVKYITALGSTAHTYGNVLATTQKWVMDIFEKNPFKTIHVSSTIAHKQILTTPHQFLKKSKPMIIFRPRIEYNEETPLSHTLLTERIGGPLTNSTPGIVDTKPFFYDEKCGIEIQFSETLRVMYLDITMIFDTEIQQLNYMDYLDLQIPPVNRPFDINTYLEAFLPKEIMEMVSSLSGIPIHTTDGSVHKFISYMNTNSYFPVTYKLAGSSGREEFYRYYPTNIFAIFTDRDKDQGETINHVKSNYKINLTLKLMFWSPGILYLFSRKIHDIPRPEISNDSSLVPIYADVFMLEDLNLSPGWRLYTYASYILDKPNEEVDFSSMLENSIKEVINYHIRNGIPLLNFFDVKIRRQGKLLTEGKNAHYEIDYKNQIVHFHNKSYGFYTYTIIIAIDALYINEIIKDIFKLE